MNDYKILLEKFWNGAASDKEKLQLYKMMVENEEAIKEVLQQEFSKEHTNRLSPGTSQTILESLHREIGIRASQSIEMPPRNSWGILRWAAAVLVIGFVSFFSWKLYDARNAAQENEAVLAKLNVIDNNSTTVKDIAMTDGTKIRLYPQSVIRFSSPFHTQSVRSIQLKGKADFKVQHNASQPFEVVANNIRTVDIGTEFCISAPDERTFHIALKEGSVRLAAMPNSGLSIKEMILQPGDEVHWDDRGKKMILEKTIAKQETGMPAQNTALITKEKLVFDKTPLNKVFSRLEARETVHIAFKEEDIQELTFTGTIESSDNIETALNIICKLNGLNYQKTKRAFIVAKNK